MCMQFCVVCMPFCVVSVCTFVSRMNAHFLGVCMQFCRVLYALSVCMCAILYCVSHFSMFQDYDISGISV